MPTITSYFGFLLAVLFNYNLSSIYRSEQDTTYLIEIN